MPLSRGSPGLIDYLSHLQLLECWMHDLGQLGVDSQRLTAEADAIAADLHECDRLLGAVATAKRCAPAPARMATRPTSSAFRWGARYVLEGSRLGAGFLHRKLAGPLAPHSLTYLSGAGWMRDGAGRDFLLQLQQQVGTPAEIADACDGANAAFSLLLHRCHARTASP